MTKLQKFVKEKADLCVENLTEDEELYVIKNIVNSTAGFPSSTLIYKVKQFENGWLNVRQALEYIAYHNE